MIKRIDPNSKPLIPLKNFELKNKENIVDKNLSLDDIKQYNDLLKKYYDRANKVLNQSEKQQEADDAKKEREALEALEKITVEDLKLFDKQTFQEAFLKTLPEEWQKQIKQTMGEKDDSTTK